MNAVHGNGGEFVLQAKKNCPELYAELMGLFEGPSEDSQSGQKQKGWIMTQNGLGWQQAKCWMQKKCWIIKESIGQSETASTMYWMKHLEKIKAP